ncbi:enoyl-CoA hydratase/isomerase family protein [Streptomyces canus]|uniref:enoyl-CoA hydratase/isomerase family protein n=1 Tax=Streptomyces canus TaxID=58343 RepID=UPI0027885B49|nr:enoyl-CoA hydratase/isomerase family protein [Streptomyces canus]MDQ0758817.1 enoyl-CoA hydratase/carnithine racemase [Streptomyces canus]
MSHLGFDINDHVAEIVLDNPPQNRIDEQMAEELLAAVEKAESSGARAILLRAEGPDFCFGGDIVTWPELDVRQLRMLFERYMFAFNRFEQIPVPVIAAVNGLCFGGGFELALRSDVIFAGEGARFGHPEQTLGLVTLLGGIYRSAARAGRARAYEWALTSEQVPAATMAQAGVVNHVLPDAEVLEAARAFARKVAAGPTRAHAAHKALLRMWEAGGVKAADDSMFDIAIPLFESKDVAVALTSAVTAYKAGRPRPTVDFTGE